MGYAADVKALTADLSKLTDQINKMHVAISLAGKDSVGIFSAVRGALSSGGQRGNGKSGNNRLDASFGYLNTPPPVTSMDGGGQGGKGGGGTPSKTPNGGGAMFSALGQMGKAGLISTGLQAVATVGSTLYNAVPDSSGVVNRAGSYYQAALRSPGMGRAGLERATFSALKGGITSVGSDANVANILTNAGYAPGGVDYLSATRQVGGAAKYLGMQNENAASAIAGLQGGPMSAQLYQYGITTMDAKGNAKSVGSIAQQLYKVMFPSGATDKSVQASIRSGYAGLNLQGLGMSADQQQMMSQALTDIAAGKNPDLASVKSAVGNQNPFDPMFRANTSSTMIQGAAEKNTISGLGAAAGTIETFNNSMKDVIASMALFKGYMDGLSGNPQGAALKKGGISLLNLGKKAFGFGMMAVGAASSIPTGGMTVPLIAGGAAIAFSPDIPDTPNGGGTPGFGSSFGGRNLTLGKSSNSLISAGYGARDSQGGNWDSTGGVHQGTDYDVPSGGMTVPLIAGGAALAFSGGGNPGYGSSFGGRNMGASRGASSLITAAYGARDAQGGNWDSTGGVHQGTDYDVPSGTPVIAVKEGIVSKTTLSADYGQAVIIDHDGGYSSVYAHLSNKSVSPGTRIFQGQELGKSGKSGNATGPHLHYEVWHGNNNPVDPAELKGAGLPVTSGSISTQTLGISSAGSLAGVVNAQDILGGVATSGGGSMSLSKGTGDKKTWATQLLTALGAPVSDSSITALTTWQSREGGHWNNSASFNPLNTTYDPNKKYESINSVGVRRYPSWDEGIAATVNTLTGNNADSRGYSAIVNALKSGASTETILSAVSNSAWVTGKTGQNSYKGFKGGGTPGSPGIANTSSMEGVVTPSSISVTSPSSGSNSTETILSAVSNSAWVTGKTGQNSYKGFKGGGTPGSPGIANTSSMEGVVTPPSVSVTSPSGGSNVVNFNVYLHDVSDAQAMIWAKKVESYISGKKEISAIGGK